MAEGLAGESNASPEEIADYYDAWATAGYDEDVASWGYEAPERVADQVAAHLDRQPGEVLDAGCGTGRVGAALHAVGVRNIVAGDFTPASIEAGRARNVYRDVDHLDLNQPLTFDDDRFTAVVSVGVFSYLTETEATIRELLRVATPGGLVIFTQRTDLWDARQCSAIIESLVGADICDATLSEPQPYLPGHPEFGTEIDIIYTTLIKR